MSEEKKSPEASPNDTIANNRTIAVVNAKELPRIPSGFRPSTTEVLRNGLRKVEEASISELLGALQVCVQKGRALQEELGKKTPPVEKAEELITRINDLQDTLAIARPLLTYLEELEDIALSDGVIYLESIKRAFDNNADDPNLAADYAKVLKFFIARSGKISEGIAAKKALEEALKKNE
jgi:translation initiation factor 2B subunit (eIF-2B alpha/beta/delta family)